MRAHDARMRHGPGHLGGGFCAYFPAKTELIQRFVVDTSNVRVHIMFVLVLVAV